MTVTATPGAFDPVENFEDFFRFYQDELNKFKYREQIHELYADSGNTLLFFYEDLIDYDPKLAHELYANPEKILDDAVEAFENLLRIETGGTIDEDGNYTVQVTSKGYQLHVPLHQLQAEHVNKLVLVDGIVAAQGTAIPIPWISVFECPECGHQFEISQEGLLLGVQILRVPTRCLNPACRGKKGFIPLPESSTFINGQTIVIQGDREENFAEVNVRLTRSLANSSLPGDLVSVVGIYRGTLREHVSHKGLVPDLPFIRALSVRTRTKGPDLNKYTSKELDLISELFSLQDLKETIMRSIAPNVLGLNRIKEAALLACVSCRGDPEANGDFREELFINIVSEHEFECGKILHFLHELIPFSRISTGLGTPYGSLVARSAEKWENLGKPFYAGTFLRAKNSVVFLQDLKLVAKKDQGVLKEILGTQKVSQVPPQVPAIDCQCAVVAVTSPKDGAYNPWKPFADNASISPELSSLFDISLVDFERNTGGRQDETRPRSGQEHLNIIAPELLSKYITRARALKVTVPMDVTNILEKFCRDMDTSNDEMRVYLKNLYPVLTRITMAYAKLHGRSTAIKLDAEYATDLARQSLQDLGINHETPSFDIDRLMTGHSQVQVAQIGKVLEILRDMEEENGNKPVELDALKERVALEGDMRDADIEDALKALKKEGDIIYPMNGLVKSVRH